MSWLAPLFGSMALMASSPPVIPLEDLGVDEAEAIALQRERYDRVTVPVTIGDSGPYRFLIDTGAQATVLSTRLADELALNDRGEATIVGMSSRKQAQTVQVDDFGLGSRRFTIRVAPLIEQSNLGLADGILGLDSLQDQRVLLDFAGKQIHVADSGTLGGNRGYEITVKARRKLGQLVIADARIEGIRTAVIIDTGAQSSVGNLALKERLRSRSSQQQSTMTDINGVTTEGPIRRVGRMNLGRVNLSNFMMFFTDAPPFEVLGLQDQPAMILGMNELRAFRRVAIDFKTRRVLFDMPSEREWMTQLSRSHTRGRP